MVASHRCSARRAHYLWSCCGTYSAAMCTRARKRGRHAKDDMTFMRTQSAITTTKIGGLCI
eukprot:scaffold345_cov104-Isochrysis_galbana.AAC.3